MPALTTVYQDFADLGAKGVAALMRAIDGTPSPLHSTVRPTVVWRESAAASPAHPRS